MDFYKVEYPIPGNVEDTLAWLEKDMQRIEPFDNGKVRVTYELKREGNVIEVFHTFYEPKESASKSQAIKAAKKYLHKEFEETDEFLLLHGKSFSFEGERVTDTMSVIVCQYQSENLYIEKLLFLYLARLGRVFNADFKESAMIRFQEIQEQIEKEQGWHWGYTEWRVDESGTRRRAFAQIPNTPEPAQPTTIDPTQTDTDKLPSDIKVTDIDSLIFDISQAKTLYRDFSVDKAREILKAVYEKSNELRYREKLKSGMIANEKFMSTSLVSNHFRVLYTFGIRTVEGIPLPYKPKNSTK